MGSPVIDLSSLMLQTRNRSLGRIPSGNTSLPLIWEDEAQTKHLTRVSTVRTGDPRVFQMIVMTTTVHPNIYCLTS